MRVAKWIGLAIAGVVAVLAVGLLLLAMLFDPNDYKADIERWAEARLQRKLALQGDLQLSVFPWIAVELGPAQLGERAGFGDQPFVAVDQVRLSLRLLPLLRGSVEIGDVLLRKPRIRLITDERGRRNWSDLLESQETAPTDPTAQPVRATVASVRIEDGLVELEDRQERARTAIRDLDLSTSRIASGKPFDLEFAFQVEQADQPPMPVQFTARVIADFDAQRHVLNDVTLDSRWFARAGQKGTGAPIALRIESAAVDLARQTLSVDGLGLTVGRGSFTGTLQGQEILDAAQWSGRIELAPVVLRDWLRELGVEVPSTRDPKALEKLEFAATIAATDRSVTLRELRMKLDDSTVTGELGIVDLAAQALRFDLAIDRLDVDRYLPPPAPESEPKAQASDAAAQSAPTPIPVEFLRALNARGDVRIGAAQFSGLRLEKLHLGIHARDGMVRLTPTDAALYGGQYRGALSLEASGKAPRLTVESHATGIDFKPLFKDFFQTERIAGRGNAHLKVTGVGADTLAMQKTLAGTLDFNVSEGAFEGTDLWYEIKRARALWKREALPERSGPARTLFNTCKGTGVIQNGVLTNNDLDIGMQFLKVAGRGSVDLVRSTLDYRLDVQVLRVSDDPAAADLVDARIPVTVAGPLGSPTVRPDIQGLVKARVREEVDKQKEKLREKLQDKLQELFRR